MTSPTFTCQRCLKTMIGINDDLYEKVYRGETLCAMCRKASGQTASTPEQMQALFAEESLEKATRRST